MGWLGLGWQPTTETGEPFSMAIAGGNLVKSDESDSRGGGAGVGGWHLEHEGVATDRFEWGNGVESSPKAFSTLVDQSGGEMAVREVFLWSEWAAPGPWSSMGRRRSSGWRH
jgi:hypothetical protein